MLASVIIEGENGLYKDEPKRPFRTRTLGLLQKTFKDKSNLKASEFRGFVAYICGLYKVTTNRNRGVTFPRQYE